jgi:hypothetical protein
MADDNPDVPAGKKRFIPLGKIQDMALHAGASALTRLVS